MNDEAKRELGIRSSMALEGLEITIWRRSVETMRAAESEYDAGTLSPERAQLFLIALLEQKRLVASLRSQLEEGIRAQTRLNRHELAKPEERPAGNRWMRSRVKVVHPADAAS